MRVAEGVFHHRDPTDRYFERLNDDRAAAGKDALRCAIDIIDSQLGS